MTTAVLEWILMGAAGLAAFAIATRSPFNAFCVLLVALPFEGALVYPSVFTITPPQVALLLLIVVYAWHATRRPMTGRVDSPLHPFVLLYLGISVLSVGMTIVAPPPLAGATAPTGWRATELRSVIQISLLLLMSVSYFATVYFCPDAKRVKQAITIYMTTAALIGLYGIYQVFAAVYYLPMVSTYVQSYFGTAASFRTNSTFREPLLFGHYVLTALPIAIVVALHRDQLPRPDRAVWGIGLVPAIGVLGAALLATIARGAWLGFAGAVGVMAIVSWRRTLRAIPIASLLTTVAVVTIRQAYGSWYEMYATVANRFAFTNPANLAAEQRLPFIPFLLGLARQHPVLGVGYGNYPLYQLDRFGGDIAGAYGLFFQALVESGVLGLAALLAMVAAYYVIMWRALQRAAGTEWWPWLAGCLCAFTGLLIQYFTFGDRLGIYVWVFIGLSMAMVNVVNDQLKAHV